MYRILTIIFYIAFQDLKVLLIKICIIQSLDLLFLVVFISCYISWYHFSHVFRTLFNIIYLKKRLSSQISFFNGFTQPPPPSSTLSHPLNSQSSLSITKVFCQCSLTNCSLSGLLLLCYDGARKN